MKKIFTFISPISTYFVLYNTSFAASACSFVGVQTFKVLVETLIRCLLTPVAGLLVSLAVIFFLYGVFKFISAEESEQIRSEGKEFMFWGIVGIFVMVSLWGLVGVLQNTFMLDTGASIDRTIQDNVSPVDRSGTV
jgi:hypothetical protein